MELPTNPSAMVDRLRAWFFAKDRGVLLPSGTFFEAESITTPGNPPINRGRLYWKNSCWYALDENGTETPLCNGAWADFTPSLYQSAAVAATVNYARLFLDNSKVTIICRLTATAAGTVTNNIYIIIPTTYTPASGTTSSLPLGEGTYVDGSVYYTCGVFYLAAVGGGIAFGLRVSSVTDGNVIGVNPNIAIASNDIIAMDITFEVS